jgi:hypothetical protein
MGETGGGDLEGGKGCRGMTLDFTALTVETCSGPLSYIAIDVRPNISVRDQTLGCLDTRVGKVMERLENGATKCLRDERSRFTSRNVTGNGVG